MRPTIFIEQAPSFYGITPDEAGELLQDMDYAAGCVPGGKYPGEFWQVSFQAHWLLEKGHAVAAARAWDELDSLMRKIA